MNFIRENWLILASTLGIGGALAAIGRYIWTRFTGWIERNDLESQKLRLEKIGELIQLREKFATEGKDEELFVHTILKTATTSEIIKLTNQLNKNNSGFKYYRRQLTLYTVTIVGIIAFSILISLNTLSVLGINLATEVLFIPAVIFGVLMFSIIGTEKSKKKLSTQFIASAIIQAKSRDEVDAVITKALQGETFVESAAGFKGLFLEEIRPISTPYSKSAPMPQNPSSPPHTQTTTPTESQ